MLLVASMALLSSVPIIAVGEESPGRVTKGLIALYDFAGQSTTRIRDRSAAGYPIDLVVEDPACVQQVAGGLKILEPTVIRSIRTPRRLAESVRRSDALTIEAWIQPAHFDQSGPARIVSLSAGPSVRNFTLGQQHDAIDVRLRTTKSNHNGLPSLASPAGTVSSHLMHVLYTRDRDATAQVYVDGSMFVSGSQAGSLGNWDPNLALLLADETGGGRSWLGTYYLVAVYERALAPAEVLQNYRAGHLFRADSTARHVVASDARQRRFELEVAAIFAHHCLECHDSLQPAGGLDLSQRQAAMTGGESGPVIVSSDAAESLLWQQIASDQMPLDRPSLTDTEKQVIHDWIGSGASWSLNVIDPALYQHSSIPRGPVLRRLTIPEYVETIAVLFDINIADEAHRVLPPDVRADGFSNTAYNLQVDLQHVDAYRTLSEHVVGKIDNLGFARKYSDPIKFTDASIGNLIRKMGRIVLRGPLTNEELITYRGIATTTAATSEGDLDEAVGLIIQAMLQSPRFLYHVERHDEQESFLSEHQLANRLSYIVWGGPPTEWLYHAATNGWFDTPQKLNQTVSKMLADPRAIEQSKRFFADWLNLDRLRHLRPDPQRFPRWDPALAADMRAETVAYFQHIAWDQRRPLTDLLNAQVTFASPRLARHYGLPGAGSGTAATKFDLHDVPERGGLLTQGSVLTIGGDDASMVTRGLFVFDELLRGVVQAPPPCVDTRPVPTRPGLTQRKVALQRIADNRCGGCHARFEPLAFALERYDGTGEYHLRDEHENPLREDGEIYFPGGDTVHAYDTTAALMDLLAANERVKATFTWKLTQFALGRPLTAADAREVQSIHAKAIDGGGTYASTMLAIATSSLVTTLQTN